MSKGCNKQIVVSKETFDLIMEDCREEYIKHHPELEGGFISHNQLMIQIAKFYLRNG